MDPMASSRKQEDPLLALLSDARLWDEVDVRLSSGGAQRPAEPQRVEGSEEPSSRSANRGLPDSLR